MTANLQTDVQETPDRSQAQQMAASELAKSQYHNLPPAQGSVTSLPSIGAPTPPPPPPPTSSTTTSDPTVILVIVGAIALVLILVLVLRAIGRPRGAKKAKTKKAKAGKSGAAVSADGTPAFDEVLFGAALHRRNAEQAAGAELWAEAIRERFRAVISTLDERGLLPERPERTADEAARDAGEILPQHREPLSSAARAFDEVEYGRYLGSSEAYAQICAVDEQIAAAAAQGLRAVRR